MSSSDRTATIRQPAVSGQFYPASAAALAGAVEGYLGAARAARAEAPDGSWPKAVIAPHAGFVYSGPIAASAYDRLLPARGSVERVVLLGPSHRVGFRGLAAPSVATFETPLGNVAIDRDAIAAIAALPQVHEIDQAHAQEHSLEVQLPFLQKVLGDFKLVPLVVGEAGPGEVAGVLEALWGGPETLIVVSTDLSHYLDYESAQRLDKATAEAIERLDVDGIAEEGACGRRPVRGLLALARAKGLVCRAIDVRNSGDTAGSRDRVVGYGSFVLEERQAAALDEEKQRALGAIARAAIRQGLEQGKQANLALDGVAPDLMRPGAAFVTLKLEGRLRGCIGSLAAHQALALDVAKNAHASAFKDRRFNPLTAAEFAGIEIAISILSPPQEMSFSSEADLVAQIRPGLDGMILADQGKRGTFLPTVWESYPEAATFFQHLKRKAGLKPDHWSDTVKVWRYTTESFEVADES